MDNVMKEYLIKNSGDEYLVYFNSNVVLSAKRKRTFFGVEVNFYCKDGSIKFYSKQRDILGIWVISHNLTFMQESSFSRIKSTKKGKGFEHNGITYSMEFKFLGKTHELFLDGNKTDSFFEVVYAQVGEHRVLVRCPDQLMCEMFTVLYILLDWYDVS